MKQVIMIHGMPDEHEILDDKYPSPSNSHWFPWIQKQLLKKGIVCQTPEMPHPHNPTYEDHSYVMDQFNVLNDTILVGHSCGASFLIKYLSERKEIIPEKVILVAPWLDPEYTLGNDFFKFEINDILNSLEVICIYSEDDDKDIIDSVNIIKEKIPNTKIISYKDKGHFTDEDLGASEFPELLELIGNK